MPTITPLNAPAVANSQAQNQQGSREKAIAAFNAAKTPAAQSQEHPVSNPSNVSAEELSAITTPSSDKGHETSNETAPQEKPAATEAKEDPISSQYAVLARKEKALRAKVHAQEQAIKAREAAFAEREAAIKAKEAEYASSYIPKNKLTEDPLTTLLEAGVTYDQLTQMALNSSQAADPATKLAIQKLEAQVKAQAEAMERADKQREQSVQSQYNEAIKQIRNDATKLVKADDSFELVRETNSIKDVVDLIERTYKEDGVILDVEEAAQAVEDLLAERISKYARTKKIQQSLQPKAGDKPIWPSKDAKAPQTSDKPQQQLKTLTNAVGSTRPLTAKERAVLAFQGKLTK